jgi:hypothetical protein
MVRRYNPVAARRRAPKVCVVISTSLVCCAFTPQLSANPTVGRTMLIGTVLGAVSCLVMYGILLRVMLRSTPHEPIPTTGDQGGR